VKRVIFLLTLVLPFEGLIAGPLNAGTTFKSDRVVMDKETCLSNPKVLVKANLFEKARAEVEKLKRNKKPEYVICDVHEECIEGDESFRIKPELKLENKVKGPKYDAMKKGKLGLIEFHFYNTSSCLNNDNSNRNNSKVIASLEKHHSRTNQHMDAKLNALREWLESKLNALEKNLEKNSEQSQEIKKDIETVNEIVITMKKKMLVGKGIKILGSERDVRASRGVLRRINGKLYNLGYGAYLDKLYLTKIVYDIYAPKVEDYNGKFIIDGKPQVEYQFQRGFYTLKFECVELKCSPNPILVAPEIDQGGNLEGTCMGDNCSKEILAKTMEWREELISRSVDVAVLKISEALLEQQMESQSMLIKTIYQMESKYEGLREQIGEIDR
jgi:hypothetical protein